MQKLVVIFILIAFPFTVAAGLSDFTKGPVFKKYGENAPIEGGLESAETQKFKVVFDVSEQTGKGKLNRGFNTIARFINMHARAGVPLENMEVALVVHGKASLDLLHNSAYESRLETDSANEELVSALLRAGVEIYLCGQSAVYSEINQNQIISGVELSLSAMTANALLQQRGFTLNPF